MLTGLAGSAGFASLHFADPGSAGGSEFSGGSPTYARKAITWTLPPNPAVGLVSSNAPLFDVAAGSQVRYFGLWTLASGGTFLGSGVLPAEDYARQGQYRLDAASIDLP